MSCTMRRLFRVIGPDWLLSLVLSIPPALFFPSHDGRFIALCGFLAGCAAVVVASFGVPLSPVER